MNLTALCILLLERRPSAALSAVTTETLNTRQTDQPSIDHRA